MDADAVASEVAARSADCVIHVQALGEIANPDRLTAPIVADQDGDILSEDVTATQNIEVYKID